MSHTIAHGAEATAADMRKHDKAFDPDAMTPFEYLHPDPTGDNLLEVGLHTIRALDDLGNLMAKSTAGDEQSAANHSEDSTIPPVYTYWGQFIDHELTARTDRNDPITITADVEPLDPNEIVVRLFNRRTPNFELDAVYGSLTNPADQHVRDYQASFAKLLRDPGDMALMRVGLTTPVANAGDAAGKSHQNDLPRVGTLEDAMAELLGNEAIPEKEVRAVIGDPRNDENLIVAQFHTALLRFHNSVVTWRRTEGEARDENNDEQFEKARKVVRWVFQWLVVNDYLKMIAVPSVVEEILDKSASRYRDRQGNRTLFMPLEFSTAGFRFGHSMIRNTYDFNRNFGNDKDKPAKLSELFCFTGNGGLPHSKLAEKPSTGLPSNWIIDWSRFVEGKVVNTEAGHAARFARAIDTSLTPPLADLPLSEKDKEMAAHIQLLLKQLARRNLRRSYVLSIPTGQAMARHFGYTPLTPGELRHGTTLEMQHILERGGFLTRTPLWYYLLKEAELNGGNELGILGSAIVAETIIGVLLMDGGSYLSVKPDWNPGLPVPGATSKPLFGDSQIKIGDLLRFAGVL